MGTVAALSPQQWNFRSGSTVGFRRFQPSLALGFQQQFQNLVRRLCGKTQSEAVSLLVRAIDAADERQNSFLSLGLSSSDTLPTLRYAATLRLLRDLVIQGWTAGEDEEGVILDLPGINERLDDPEETKMSLRRSFSFAREGQLRQPSTLRFIDSMERTGIGRIFADGCELAGRLTGSLGPTAIRPELELIEPGARDATTGLLLQDIWRYARHYWSIPYQSTPGRNIFYLVRDAAFSSRPLIGIAALGNPVLGLGPRDDFYGWTAHGVAKHLKDMSPSQERALAAHISSVIESGLRETYVDDLGSWGVHGDWRATVAGLEQIEHRSAAERLHQLEKAGEDRTAEYFLIRSAHSAVERGDEKTVDWERIARTTLYRRKRAKTLADLIRAQGILSELGFSADAGSINPALGHEEGVRAIEIALRRIKQQVIASSVMELITCGAVPPYREVLGGKLVAILMTSGQVMADFQHKYGKRTSLIASALAARPIHRPPRLALVTTSSLYPVGSSQYNRINIPLRGGAITYRRIGTTDSFGTVHLAVDTADYLSVVARLSEFNRRQVNNLFGEGTSPRLRVARAGLDSLGLDSNIFLRHHSPRIIYGAGLCSNLEEVLLGLSEKPDYLLSPGSSGTQELVEHWRERWLRTRIGRPDVLERLRNQNFSTFRLSSEAKSVAEAVSLRRPTPVSAVAPASSAKDKAASGRETFIERLYRGRKSYADRLTPEELDSLHIDLGADDYLLNQIKARQQVILTGNPGDGKTHLIERLRTKLEALGARVITDANACSDDQILDTWQLCRRQGFPFVLAINEWPLYVLQRLALKRDFTAVSEALCQVNTARFFIRSQEPEPPKDGVVVIDLSLRTLLAPSVVEQVIERLTQDRYYHGHNAADPALSNRGALRTDRVRKRLEELLRLVGTRVDHVTMRQLVGFVAFLITGGRSEPDRLKAGQDTEGFSYSSLAFEGGVGPLFDAVRAVFDPAAVTHPDWDERLWLGVAAASEWLHDVPPGPISLPESARESAFRSIKRRFFFEHESGMELMRLVPKDEYEFQEILRSEEETRPSLIRDLMLALNRFYEPECSEEECDRLRLWQSHRYDVRAPSSFVVLRSLPYQQFRIERLKLASWVQDWLPAAQRDRRSFALIASVDGRDVALLEIDRDLYLTLFEARRGLGRSSWSRTAARRITRFVDRINRSADARLEVEDVRIRNVESDLEERFAIQRSPAKYQL